MSDPQLHLKAYPAPKEKGGDIGKVFQKHNSVIDGVNRLGLHARRLMNGLYWLAKREGQYEFTLKYAEVRKMLEMNTNNDYAETIANAFLELRRETSCVLKNVKVDGKTYKNLTAGFLDFAGDRRSLEDERIKIQGADHIVDIKISKPFVTVMEETVNWTVIDVEVTNKLRSKFSLELYEKLRRYWTLPNKKTLDPRIGVLEMSLDDLNALFDTKYKYVSEMQRKLDQACKELLTKADMEVNVFFNKNEEVFMFSWGRGEESGEVITFPPARIPELADWIVDHMDQKKRSKVANLKKYRNGIVSKLRRGQWKDAESFYRGMIKEKYGVNPDEYYIEEERRFKDFPNPGNLPLEW